MWWGFHMACTTRVGTQFMHARVSDTDNACMHDDVEHVQRPPTVAASRSNSRRRQAQAVSAQGWPRERWHKSDT